MEICGKEVFSIDISLNLAIVNHNFPQKNTVAQNPQIGLKSPKNCNPRLPKSSRPMSLKTAELGEKTAELATLLVGSVTSWFLVSTTKVRQGLRPWYQGRRSR